MGAWGDSVLSNNSNVDSVSNNNIPENMGYKARIIENKLIDKNTLRIRLSFDQVFTFKPGQYIWLVLEQLQDDEQLDRRAFSICSAVGSVKEVEIMSSVTPSLYKKTLLSLPTETEVLVYGPHGSSYTLEDKADNYLFLAAGLGVTPFMSIIRSLAQSNADNTKVRLIYSHKKDKKPLFEDELIQLVNNHDWLSVDIRPGDLSTAHVKSSSEFVGGNTRVFVCGPQQYVNVASTILEEMDVRRSNVHYEQYHPLDDYSRTKIRHITDYVNEIASATDIGSIMSQQSGFFQQVRHKILLSIMTITSIAIVLLLGLQLLNGNSTQANLFFLELITYLVFNLSLIALYAIFKRYTLFSLLYISGFGIVLSLNQFLFNFQRIDLAWILLPVALYFFFEKRVVAIVSSILYILFILTTAYYYQGLNYLLSNINMTEVTLFGLNVVILVLMLLGLSKIFDLAESTILSRVGAFNTLLKAVNDSNNHIIITDINGITRYANKAAAKNTGFSISQMLGQSPRLWGGLMDSEYYKNLWIKKKRNIILEDEIKNRNKNGEIYFVNAHISAIRDENKRIIGYLASEQNITEIKDKNLDLEKANDIMVNRELRMIELKEQLEKVAKKRDSGK